VLNPREHYTDTHGCTEQLLGLCYLADYSFMPRLKDLKEQRIYPARPRDIARRTQQPVRGAIDVALVREQWDQLVLSRRR
jgi:TnpA family transposase